MAGRKRGRSQYVTPVHGDICLLLTTIQNGSILHLAAGPAHVLAGVSTLATVNRF